MVTDLVERAAIFAARSFRHLEKVRAAGVSRVAGEDLDKTSTLLRKVAWRLTHNEKPNAVPVFVVGLQRSGTKMLIFGLNRSSEVKMYNEHKRSLAFENFELRGDATVRSLVTESPFRFVVFKALCDSHRVGHLLDELGAPSSGRAIWIYRSMEGRVRSAVARFGDNNLRVLSSLASGVEDGRWQSGGLTPRLREIISRFDYDPMTEESAAALWWYVRNSLYFELGLHERKDIMLTSYDRFVAEPEAMMRAVCAFLGIRFDERMIAGISPREAPSAGTLAIDDDIRELCSELEQRLDEWFDAHGRRPASAAA